MKDAYYIFGYHFYLLGVFSSPLMVQAGRWYCFNAGGVPILSSATAAHDWAHAIVAVPIGATDDPANNGHQCAVWETVTRAWDAGGGTREGPASGAPAFAGGFSNR